MKHWRSRIPSTWTSSTRRVRTGSTAPTATSTGSASMDLGLRGKVALVAASSTGLGRAVAEELAREGANLVLCARGEERLVATAQAIRSETGVRVETVAADL